MALPGPLTSIDARGDAVQQQPPRPHPDPRVEVVELEAVDVGVWLAAVDDGGHEVGAEHGVNHDGHPREEIGHEEAAQDERRVHDRHDHLQRQVHDL